MIRGTVVNGIEATLQFRVFGPNGQQNDIDVVLDTGFTGELTLPRKTIESLGLLALGFRKAVLANGQFAVLRMFEVTAVWDGENRTVQVLEAQGSPLVGMSMLKGFRSTVDVVEKGNFTIEALKSATSS
jgi:clan AA aspartic protease